VYEMIQETKSKVWQQVNYELIALYGKIGRYVSAKVDNSGWGQNVVQELADYIQRKDPAIKGFSARNIWRMKKFYETYNGYPKLSTLLTEISWSNHLHILSKTNTLEEKEFYLNLTAKHSYAARTLARLIDTGTFERTLLADKKLSTALTEVGATKGIFKDSYIFEFLSLSDGYKETDLRHALIQNLKKFLIEMGPDFSFIGEEYPLQVGMRDFRIDLLMFHRNLNCMVALELKVTEFQPEYLGKLHFYLEILDQNVKKSHENPTVGILICKTKDEEIVKYAMNRHLSPTMVAEYETKMIDKKLLTRKIHELADAFIKIEDDE
ncbi:MAG TPA: PDDEXK nuclease domain-containing protein, partial [Hanamia sp.]|nr:PDDEXK nuclease domain-containing protein [Hanamia sp.]